MGACEFRVSCIAENPRHAFVILVSDAIHEHGEEGYTGTIAEKEGFIEFDIPIAKNEEIDQLMHFSFMSVPELANCCGGKFRSIAQRLHDATRDKWGPAVCIKVPRNLAVSRVTGTAKKKILAGENLFIFFGLASI